jgi:hypothetical protein
MPERGRCRSSGRNRGPHAAGPAHLGQVALAVRFPEPILGGPDYQVRSALEKSDQRLPHKGGGEKLVRRLETIIAGLEKLGAVELAAEVGGWSEQVTTNNGERNHIIHGGWWWFFGEDTVSTRSLL